MKNKFKEYVFYELNDYLRSLADELLSFYREKDKIDVIKDTLLKTKSYLPKIIKEIKKSTTDWHKSLGKFADLAKERRYYLGTKIAENLERMFKAIEILEENKCSRQEIIALLITEPPEKWLKWAHRLTSL